MWERLRHARLAKGLSLEDLSAKTKIRVPVLESLEQGDVEHQLGDFYTRAALRAIAREVGLDPEEIVHEYVAEYEPPEPEPSEVRDELLTPRPPLISPFWRMALVATGGIALITFVTSRTAPPPRPEAKVVGTSGVIAAPAEAVEPPKPTKPDRLTFELRPAREVWVSATADGERVLYRLLQPAERQVVEAHNELALVIGDAGALEYSINGRPGTALGAAAEVRTLRITRDNYGEFLGQLPH